MNGRIIAVCTSEEKGTVKTPVEEATLIAGHGIEGDAHAGNWHRQVSLLAVEEVEAFCKRGKKDSSPALGMTEKKPGATEIKIPQGAFGENLLIAGIPDLKDLPVGTVLRVSGHFDKLSDRKLKSAPVAEPVEAPERDIILRTTQIGKECHTHCAIRQEMGDCIMPRVGVFAEVLQGGVVKAGDMVWLT